jgi:hypothetical protein
MAKCLNEHPNVTVFGETGFWGRHFVPPGDDGQYNETQIAVILDRLKDKGTCVRALAGDGPGCLRQVSVENVGALLDRAFDKHQGPMTPGALFSHLSEALAAAEGRPAWVEKTPHHLMWINRILTFLPDARFIVMVREPYGFMLSYQHQGDRKPKERRARYRFRYHPVGTSLVWRGYMRAICRVQERHADRIELVRFEDIRERPDETLVRVQRFLGLDTIAELAQRVPPDNTSFPAGHRPALRAEDIFWMNRIASREIAYGAFDRCAVSPSQLPRLMWSILILPIWASINALRMRHRVSGSFFRYAWSWIQPKREPADDHRGKSLPSEEPLERMHGHGTTDRAD